MHRLFKVVSIAESIPLTLLPLVLLSIMCAGHSFTAEVLGVRESWDHCLAVLTSRLCIRIDLGLVASLEREQAICTVPVFGLVAMVLANVPNVMGTGEMGAMANICSVVGIYETLAKDGVCEIGTRVLSRELLALGRIYFFVEGKF